MDSLVPEKYHEDQEIIRLVVEQIKKDFGTAIDELIFSGITSSLYGELVSQLAVSLKKVSSTNLILFRSILYRVDVSERDFPSKSSPEAFERLAETIVRREFQKVLTRRFFEGKKG